MTNGVCGPGIPILDNTCFEANLPISTAPGTTLGVDVVVSSIELVITHTFNADLDIFLISPSGSSLELSTDNGAGGNGMGDNGPPCPLTVCTYQNGGALVTSMAGDFVTGPFAAEGGSTYSAFTGSPNGNWRISVCDDLGGDTGTLDYVKVNFTTCIPATLGPATVTDDCGLGQFTVTLDVLTLGTGAPYDIIATPGGIVGTIDQHRPRHHKRVDSRHRCCAFRGEPGRPPVHIQPRHLRRLLQRYVLGGRARRDRHEYQWGA